MYVYVPTSGMVYDIYITEDSIIYLQLADKDKTFYTNDSEWKSDELPDVKEVLSE